LFLFSIVENVPAAKQGWGAKSGPGLSDQSGPTIGMSKKTNAASYWDNKTTELVIPEMDAEGQMQEDIEQVVVAQPAMMATALVDLNELNKDFSYNVPSTTPDGVDISLLTCQIRPIMDLIETDMHWDYMSLQAEIGQSFRERYGAKGGPETIEGTHANNL
jgi:hypothetical protein